MQHSLQAGNKYIILVLSKIKRREISSGWLQAATIHQLSYSSISNVMSSTVHSPLQYLEGDKGIPLVRYMVHQVTPLPSHVKTSCVDPVIGTACYYLRELSQDACTNTQLDSMDVHHFHRYLVPCHPWQLGSFSGDLTCAETWPVYEPHCLQYQTNALHHAFPHLWL